MPKKANAKMSTCQKEHMPKRAHFDKAHAEKSTWLKEQMPKRARV